MTLALLLTAVTGAWAQTDGLIMKELTVPSEWNNDENPLTVGEMTGFKDFSSLTVDEAKALLNSVPAGNVIIFYGVGASSNSFKIVKNDGEGVHVGEAPLSHVNLFVGKVNFDYKYYYTSSDAIEVTPGSSANTWTFNQPGSDVVLTPIYAKAAAFATESTSSEEKTLLPEAAEGVIAGTDASLIAEGTGIVAFAGTSTEVRQGKVWYAIGTSATTAPDLDAADTWSTDVPTAENVGDDGGDVYVWYYIQGADAPQGVAATLDNTFNNSEVSSLTVSVLSNKFDLALKAANANTIDATEASKGTVTVKVGDAAAVDKTKDITDGKLTAIKMGSEVKLNTKAGYKFRKVQVKKAVPVSLTDATTEGAVTRIKFNYGGGEYYADFTYSNGSFTRTGGSNGYTFSGNWTMKEENGVLTMTADYNEMSSQWIYFVCTFYADNNEYTAKSTGSWNYSFSGIEVNGNDITSQLKKVK